LYPRYHSTCSHSATTLGIQQFLCINAAITRKFYLLTKLSSPRLRSYKHIDLYNGSHQTPSLLKKI
ncbi:MAG: hypothetical protein IIX39_06105, partial [Clostridia bacterium]|nr:hypothetical protein [Clostridia bacterium]